MTPRPLPPRPAGAGPASRLRPWAMGLLLALSPMLSGAAPDLAKAEEIVQGKCFICHGINGESASPAFPRLAGQNAAYLARQLRDYRSGRRQSSTMQPMVEGLTPEDFQALGAYFASQPTLAHPVEDADLAQVGRFIHLRGNPDSGVAACASCHGAQAQGSDVLPRLAGQHPRYTEQQLRLFNKRERSNDNAVMQAIASKLTELEMKAVAAYLSGLK